MAFSKLKSAVADKKDTVIETAERAKTAAKAAYLSAPFVVSMAVSAYAGPTAASETDSGTDIFAKFQTIMQTIYGKICGIASVTAGCVAAVCLFLMFFSKRQQTVDESIQWLKRIVVCYVAIMLIAAILRFLVSGLDLNTSGDSLKF